MPRSLYARCVQRPDCPDQLGLAFALGAVTGLSTLSIVHYVAFLIVALIAGLSVDHSVRGLSMILNMAPFRHGGERTGAGSETC